jgi:hypothetical protein
MKKTILLILAAFLLIYHSNAQDKPVVPGYMGLKFSIQYQGGISPQWNNLSESFLPYLSHNIQVGYVVSRKYEVGLQYTRIDYSSAMGLYREDENTSTAISADYRYFTGNNLMAYIKFFRERKGFIAPLGRYFLLGLSYENSKDKYHVTADPTSTVGAPNYTTVRSSDLALTAGVGRNIIIANRMLLTIEGDVNIPITAGIRSAVSGAFSPGSYNSANPVSPMNSYKVFNANDVMLVNLIQIKIGLGALIF